jgi:hypothetical protein
VVEGVVRVRDILRLELVEIFWLGVFAPFASETSTDFHPAFASMHHHVYFAEQIFRKYLLNITISFYLSLFYFDLFKLHRLFHFTLSVFGKSWKTGGGHDANACQDSQMSPSVD